MKLCANCVHFKPADQYNLLGYKSKGYYTFAKCKKSPIPVDPMYAHDHLISPKATPEVKFNYCSDVREDESKCGLEGKWFKG
jgi:hypothetical protein